MPPLMTEHHMKNVASDCMSILSPATFSELPGSISGGRGLGRANPTPRGLALGGLTFWVFQASLTAGGSLAHAQTIAFATLIFAQLWHLFDSRFATTLFSKDPFGNRTLLGAVALLAVLTMLAINTPVGNFVLGTEPLALRHLLEAIALAALPTLGLSELKEIFGLPRSWLVSLSPGVSFSYLSCSCVFAASAFPALHPPSRKAH